MLLFSCALPPPTEFQRPMEHTFISYDPSAVKKRRSNAGAAVSVKCTTLCTCCCVPPELRNHEECQCTCGKCRTRKSRARNSLNALPQNTNSLELTRTTHIFPASVNNCPTALNSNQPPFLPRQRTHPTGPADHGM